jgi:4-diphosphocytidyl-2-C-methyl-D-erythritol kinase
VRCRSGKPAGHPAARVAKADTASIRDRAAAAVWSLAGATSAVYRLPGHPVEISPVVTLACVQPVRVRVPGKVNLHLGVGPLRRDGFHELTTVFQAVDVTDDVVAAPAHELALTVHGPVEVPRDGRNLAWQAAQRLAAHAGVAPRVHLTVDKAIPVAGGMAGGSADAAAALVACRELWRTATPPDELAMLAAELGSDVTFPLLGGTALGTGRGEVLAPVLSRGRFHWVFALAAYGITARAAYEELDRQRASAHPPVPVGRPDAVIDAVRSGDPHRLAPALANDLEPAALALVPALRRTLAAGRELGALAGIVSGSGPTCAFLVSSPEAGARLAASLAADGVCRTAKLASGPVPGARVVR